MSALVRCALCVAFWLGLGGCTARDCKGDSPYPRVTNSASAPSTQPRSTMSNELIEAIAGDDVITISQLLEERAPVDVPALIAEFKSRPPSERSHLVKFVAHYGCTREARLMVMRPDAVAGIVHLMADPAPQVREAAASVVSGQVPDDLARRHAAELTRLIEENPASSDLAWIAGRLGSEHFRGPVQEGKLGPDLSSAARDLVLGKLGDREAEERSIKRYHDAMKRGGDLMEAPDWCIWIGYLRTNAALVALAQDIRHPGVYVHMHGVERSVRADVVEGLIEAFPNEALSHLSRPKSNEDYARIERWATANLGVTWDEPRPPYVHEVPSSTFPPDDR